MTVRSIERADVALIVIDASEGFTDQDAHIARMARDRGCATLLLANKWDLIATRGPEAATALRDAVAHGLRFTADTRMLPVSAKTGAGVSKILPEVRRLAAVAETRIPTATLNRWLKEVVERHEPAMAQKGPRKRRLKFFYATQTGTHPPTFVLFCTDPGSVQPSYRRFLENRLRERFDLEGTPVRLQLRARTDSGR